MLKLRCSAHVLLLLLAYAIFIIFNFDGYYQAGRVLFKSRLCKNLPIYIIYKENTLGLPWRSLVSTYFALEEPLLVSYSAALYREPLSTRTPNIQYTTYLSRNQM